MSRPARGDIVVTSTIPDLGNIGGMLFDIERKVLTRARPKVLTFIKTGWTGWKYVGRPADKLNISFKAWKAKVVVNTPSPELHITNEARGYRSGNAYVAYIRRSKGAELEWEKVYRQIAADFAPVIAADLLAEVSRNLNTPRRPTRVRGARADTLVVAAGVDI